MKTVSFCTLGCKVNQYETEVMCELFKEKGYIINDFPKKSDIYVINTCTVTNMSDRKSRQMIHKAQSNNPDAVIIVTGCYSQVSSSDVEKIEGVNVILGNNGKEKILKYAENVIKQKPLNMVDDISKTKEYTEMKISTHREKTRAYIKIEDGCNSFCSYCIIPYARGRVRSRNMDDILKEVSKLTKEGFSEFVLTGIHIASYGLDKGEYTLIHVIEKIAEIPGVITIRLGSIEPRILTEEFVKRLADTGKVANHFHISLQSGCDETLKRMNRKYLTSDYKKSVEYLRKHFDNPAIATDIMVGFPGETDEEFDKSFRFMEEIRFADAHVFSYSRRKGTIADKMPNQISPAIKNERNKKMCNKVKELKEAYLSQFMGKTSEVLFEQINKDGLYEGTASNYIKVAVKSNEDLSGLYRRVLLKEIKKDYVTGEIIL